MKGLDAFLNEGGKMKHVTKQMWDKMTDEEQEVVLMTAFEDPDTAEKYIGVKWEKLPSHITSNMVIWESMTKNERFDIADMFTKSISRGVDSFIDIKVAKIWWKKMYDDEREDIIREIVHKLGEPELNIGKYKKLTWDELPKHIQKEVISLDY